MALKSKYFQKTPKHQYYVKERKINGVFVYLPLTFQYKCTLYTHRFIDGRLTILSLRLCSQLSDICCVYTKLHSFTL